MKVWKWPRQSLDPYPTENLWGDLKRAVLWRCPCSLTYVERFYKKEWENMTKARCAKTLSAVEKSKGASTNY